MPFGPLTRALLMVAALPTLAPAGEYGPAARPRTFAVSGEAALTFAPIDDGYFNETDYGSNALRLLRLDLAARWQPLAAVAVVADLRSDTGLGNHHDGAKVDARRPLLHALYVHVRPWPSRAVDLQAGRVPPVFGAFPRRRYAADNPLIGYPLAYQYLVALRPDALPADASELFAARGRGWRPPFASAVRGGLPMVSGVRWDTGVQAHVGEGVVRLGAAVTQGSLSNPRTEDDNGGKQVAARLAFHPGPAWALGVSAARGAWVARTALDAGADRPVQQAAGLDVEFAHGPWVVRAEALRASFEVPTAEAPRIADPVRATAVMVEVRRRLTAGLDVAARGDRLSFGRLSDDLPSTTWEAPVWRAEAGLAFAATRRLRLKAAYQHNWRDGGFVREESFLAGQVSWWF